MPIFFYARTVFGDEHYRELAERVGHHGLMPTTIWEFHGLAACKVEAKRQV